MNRESITRYLYHIGLPTLLATVSCLIAPWLISSFAPLNSIYIHVGQLGAKTDLTKPDSQIIVLATVEETPQQLGEPEEVNSIPRRYHGELCRLLAEAGVKGVIFDYVFTEARPGNDEAFRQGIRQSQGMWVIVGMEPYGQQELERRAFVENKEMGRIAMHRSSIALSGDLQNLYEASLVPLPGEDDSLIGVQPIQLNVVDNMKVYHASYVASLLLSGNRVPNMQSQDSLIERSFDMPNNRAFELPKSRIIGRYTTLHYAETIKSLRKGKDLGLRGKVVVIGRRDAGSDIHTFSGQAVPGVVFVAYVLDFFKNSSWTSVANSSAKFSVIAFIGSFSAALIVLIWRSWKLLFCLTIVFAAVWFTCLVAISNENAYPYAFTGAFTTLLSAGLSLGLFSMVSRRSDFRIAGQSEIASVMFLDIRDSTVIVNKIGAESYQAKIASLNRQFYRSIKGHEGILERTTGDGFIAIFRGGSKSVGRAIACAHQIVQSVNSSESAFWVSIGIEAGSVSGGYVWEGFHRVWSSTGSTVVLAQRIQTFAGSKAVPILIGPRAKKELSSDTNIHEFDRFTPKGFSDSIVVYSSAQQY